MTDKTLSSVIGSALLPTLAPDITYPADKYSNTNYKVITGIDASAGLTTALSLTGRFVVAFLGFTSQESEPIRYKLTVDGVVLWDSSHTPPSSALDVLVGGSGIPNVHAANDLTIPCEASLLLQVHTATDTSIQLNYIARAIA